MRGIREELGKEDVLVATDTHCMHVKVTDSRSYPGLPCQYVMHLAGVAIAGLSADSFSTEEYGKDGILAKTLYWEWVTEDADWME